MQPIFPDGIEGARSETNVMSLLDVPTTSTIRVLANGLDFEVLETLPASGTSEKLALCLHGFPETARSWQHQTAMLASLGYKVWAPNQRGYGGTTIPKRSDDYAIENLMDDVAALIDASGCKSVTLIAHDWGAIIAWTFATRKIRPLERLIILNVPHPMPFRKNLSLKQLRRSWYMFAFQLPSLGERMLTQKNAARISVMFKRTSAHPENFTREDIDAYKANVMRPGGAKAMLDWYRAYIRGGGSLRQGKLGYPKIDTPTLMIWGTEDLALTIETTYGTEDYVTDFTMRYLKGISHWVQQDAPAEVTAMMEAFLSGKPVPEYGDLVKS